MCVYDVLKWNSRVVENKTTKKIKIKKNVRLPFPISTSTGHFAFMLIGDLSSNKKLGDT
jgi:hypothetical protein